MAASTVAFPETWELPSRPIDFLKRARSTCPVRSARIGYGTYSMALTIREKTRNVNTRLPLRLMPHRSGITKNRTGNAPLMPNKTEGVAETRNTRLAATTQTDHTSALESLTLNMTVAQRVAWRRKKPGIPFIPRKTRETMKTAKKATRAVVRRHAAPVFGAASLPQVDPDEMALSAALKKPHTKVLNCSNRLLP